MNLEGLGCLADSVTLSETTDFHELKRILHHAEGMSLPQMGTNGRKWVASRARQKVGTTDRHGLTRIFPIFTNLELVYSLNLHE